MEDGSHENDARNLKLTRVQGATRAPMQQRHKETKAKKVNARNLKLTREQGATRAPMQQRHRE